MDRGYHICKDIWIASQQLAACAWFLGIALVGVSVCQYACVCVSVSVCLPPRPLITSGVIWCDIDRVQLVKQVLRLSLLLITSYSTCCQ